AYEVADMKTLKVEPDAVCLIKAEFALEQGVLPVSIQGDEATFVIFDPVNVEVTDQVAMMSKKKAKFLISARTNLIARIREIYGLNEGELVSQPDLKVPPRYAEARLLKEIEGVHIFEASDHDLNRIVTLFATGDKGLITRIQAAARLSTPYVAAVHDLFEFEEKSWVVLEKLEGETLAHVLKTRGPRGLSQATTLVAQVAEGIDALHQRGGYVGLVCPENILVTATGAKLVPLFKPAQAYQSPEGVRATGASDIFALGTLLWECLSSKRPHENGWETPTEASNLPLAMSEVLGRALAKDPGDRFPSALLLSSALKSYNWSVITSPSVAKTTTTTQDRDQLLSIMTSGQEEEPKAGFWQRLFRKVAA
ncbi:MAG: hypothetical protein ABL962_19650, partial [Fimbriimonadaceae bacterium]